MPCAFGFSRSAGDPEYASSGTASRPSRPLGAAPRMTQLSTGIASTRMLALSSHPADRRTVRPLGGRRALHRLTMTNFGHGLLSRALTFALIHLDAPRRASTFAAANTREINGRTISMSTPGVYAFRGSIQGSGVPP